MVLLPIGGLVMVAVAAGVGWLLAVQVRRRVPLARGDTAFLVSDAGLVLFAVLMIEAVVLVSVWPMLVALVVPEPPDRRLFQAAILVPGLIAALALVTFQTLVATWAGYVPRPIALATVGVGVGAALTTLGALPLPWRWLEPGGLPAMAMLLIAAGTWMALGGRRRRRAPRAAGSR